MTPSFLEKSLALYRVLDTADARVGGLPMGDLLQRWVRTGLRRKDFGETLARGRKEGDFVLTRERGVTRVHAGHFESRRLDPSSLHEIEQLSAAFQRLDALRRRYRVGAGSGRRARDAVARS